MSEKRKIVYASLLVLLVISCASGPKEYIVPDYAEFTAGGKFVDKYWSSFTGGKDVKLQGTYLNTMRDGDTLKFLLNVPNGIEPVVVTYGANNLSAVSKLTTGTQIIVYGKTYAVKTYRRVDRSYSGRELRVGLERFEKINY